MDALLMKKRLEQYLTDNLTEEEFKELWKSLQQPEMQEAWMVAIEESLENPLMNGLADVENKRIAYERLLNNLQKEKRVANAHRVHFLKTTWFKYAAAIIIVLLSVAYLWNHDNDSQTIAKQENDETKILPGGLKAILTLADGSKIDLENAGNGAIAQQGNSSVVKLDNGSIAYRANAGSELGLINTLVTPRGGEYQLTLRDGTKVWLNAMSSITYPSAFTGRQRRVSIKGEVYFEVAGNADTPFIVDVDNNAEVEVLGTHFNINSYTDEKKIRTTLLEGSVRVKPKKFKTNKDIILKPGEQAELNNNIQTIYVNPNVQTEQIMAWKSGFFNLQDATVQEVMRQLERWYDIEVVYEGAVPEFRFKGEMDRGLPLSGALRSLEELGLDTRLQGRTLFIKENKK